MLTNTLCEVNDEFIEDRKYLAIFNDHQHHIPNNAQEINNTSSMSICFGTSMFSQIHQLSLTNKLTKLPTVNEW